MNTQTAKDIMTGNILVARADWSLDQLAEFFVDNYISGAPVISEDDELIGVVSLTDLARHYNSRDTPSDSTHEYYFQALESRYAREEIAALRIKAEPLGTVRDIMTPMIFDVSEDALVQEVADAMVRGHIHRVFVTRDKKVVGIITALDMLKVIRDLK